MLQTIWDFIGTPQFQHLASLASLVATLVLIPLYRRLKRMIDDLKKIPVIVETLISHDMRLNELEAHRTEREAPARVHRWPSPL